MRDSLFISTVHGIGSTPVVAISEAAGGIGLEVTTLVVVGVCANVSERPKGCGLRTKCQRHGDEEVRDGGKHYAGEIGWFVAGFRVDREGGLIMRSKPVLSRPLGVVVVVKGKANFKKGEAVCSGSSVKDARTTITTTTTTLVVNRMR